MRLLCALALLAFSYCCFAQSAIPAGCLTAPFPTTPSGPVVTRDSDTALSATFRVTVWRKPCSPTSSVTLLTIQPLQGNPFICNSNFVPIQGGAQFTRASLRSNTTSTSGFCGNLLLTSTFALVETTTEPLFNSSAAFTLNIDSNSSSIPNLQLNIGAYNAADYGNTTNLVITGKQSGSWFNATRSGDGFLLEIGSTGAARTIIASWYTYDAGRQQWIFGSAPLPAGASSVTVPMITTTGANFGTAFNPQNVTQQAWGSVTFSFTGCNAMKVDYAKTGGESGTILMQRILNQIDGYACP